MLKLKLTNIEELKKDSITVKVAFFKIGETNIELIQSSEDKKILRDLLKKKDYGVHHVAFEVDDIHKVVKEKN